MLGVKSYSREYIQKCRDRVEADVAAYRQFSKTAKLPDSAFESAFFNNLAIVLDALFVHRLRVVEGKDGNPLNEVRMISNSLMLNDGVLTAEKSIKLTPAKSVLKLEFGDPIKLTDADFTALSAAFFSELEARFQEA